jgi:hypothetical protein
MPDAPSNLVVTALSYLEAGLCVLPAIPDKKRPALASWKPYRQQLPSAQQVRTWCAQARGLCIVAGAVSGNLEMIDFDGGGVLYRPWAELVNGEAPGLLDRLVVERSPSGGCHVVYRCEVPVGGNQKLAQRAVLGGLGNPATLIETRGEGGLFLCDPTPGYNLQQGLFTSLPRLTSADRDILIEAAQALNEVVAKPEPVPAPASTDALRPGDDFSARGDVRAVLQKHGWTLVKPGENEYWRRPGKDRGWSATLKDRVFYVFSSNATPFEPNKAYKPFAVYTMLEHGGLFPKAAAALRGEGYGGADQPQGDVGTSGVRAAADPPPATPMPPDPGPVPEDLLRIPGFVGEVMDHCLQTAPYPNPVLAFSGALSLQAFLAGRKVRDPMDNRTNLYLLGLAQSAAGKDHPRKINARIVNQVGLADCLGDSFASGEGIQDALFLTPSMLFQTDEIDGMLQAMNKAKDARFEGIMSTLLTMHSASNSVYPVRRKAGKESLGAIDQPCLVIFGTAIPDHYYQALSERMLTNGLFARMIILEAGPRASGQEPDIRDLPPRVLETARWWADYNPGERRGSILDLFPVPAIVEQTPEAKGLLVDSRQAAEAEYTKAETARDAVGTTVWGRVSEHVRKLALLYAVSENYAAPKIGRLAVDWASRLVMYQTRRMLFMAAGHVADNPFHAECLKVLRRLRDAPGRELPHSMLLKRMKMKAKDFKDLMETLVLGGDVVADPVETPGRTGVLYRLASQVKKANDVKEVAQETTAEE